jgi:lysophospholipase L1-like esterase
MSLAHGCGESVYDTSFSPTHATVFQTRNSFPMFAPILVLVIFLAAVGDAAEPLFVNPGFEEGLTGWTSTGAVALLREQPLEGAVSVRLGPDAGSLRQHCLTKGQHVWVELKIRGAGPWPPRLQAIQEDGAGVPVLTEQFEAKKGVYGCWMRMHPRATGFTLVIANEPGRIFDVDAVKTNEYDIPPYPAPTCDLDAYLQPFWLSTQMLNETVLLIESTEGPARGRLLYDPIGPVTLTDYGLATTYRSGSDFAVEGREIVVLPGSRIPLVKATEFKSGENQWYKIGGKHLVASYRHEPWAGLPIPAYAGVNLSRTMDRLRQGRPLRIIALGDSITFGMDVSQHLGIAPFMPTWMELFASRLRKRYPGSQVELINSAMSGAKTEWGERVAQAMVGSLRPDLVVLAFGMNDFWGKRGDKYQAAIGRMMTTIRAENPAAEFLLVAPMRFDPAYSTNPQHVAALTEYVQALSNLTGPGVATLDMTDLTAALYARKQAKDFLTNPMHPNDFLARWYAQGLVALLDAPAVTP